MRCCASRLANVMWKMMCSNRKERLVKHRDFNNRPVCPGEESRETWVKRGWPQALTFPQVHAGDVSTQSVLWASLVAQTVQNPPEMWETWVRALGWEDPLEKGMATHSSVLSWRIPMDRGAWRAVGHGVAESDTTQWLSTAQQSVLQNDPNVYEM